MLTVAVLPCLGPSGCSIFRRSVSERTATNAPSEPSPEQQMQLDAAASARAAGDYDTALGIFQDILAENPTITVAYLGLGDIYMVTEDYADAEPAFNRAARLEPRNFDAQFGHGRSLHMLERFVDAVRAFHRALALQPTNIDANMSIATTYLCLEKVDSALVYAEKAVVLDPRNGAAHSNLGAIYEMLERNDDAIDQYMAAMELMPPSTPLMLNLISVLAREKRYREVVNVAETLTKVDANADAYERMAYAWFRLGDFDRSRQAYREAVSLAPDHWQSYNGLGVNALNRWLLSKKRDEDAAREARDAFRKSLRIKVDQPKVVALLSNYQL